MQVSVGSLSDPKELPGLAHFLEHMLFYSNEKYPEEDAYSKFIVSYTLIKKSAAPSVPNLGSTTERLMGWVWVGLLCCDIKALQSHFKNKYKAKSDQESPFTITVVQAQMY